MEGPPPNFPGEPLKATAFNLTDPNCKVWAGQATRPSLEAKAKAAPPTLSGECGKRTSPSPFCSVSFTLFSGTNCLKLSVWLDLE